jgi:ribosomal protein L23
MIVIKKPVLTEKTLANYQKNKQVVFEVAISADKIKAAKELESTYGVEVKSVQVVNRVGKYKMDRKHRSLIKHADQKIMIFKLSDKDSIDLFETK